MATTATATRTAGTYTRGTYTQHGRPAAPFYLAGGHLVTDVRRVGRTIAFYSGATRLATYGITQKFELAPVVETTPAPAAPPAGLVSVRISARLALWLAATALPTDGAVRHELRAAIAATAPRKSGARSVRVSPAAAAHVRDL